MNELVLKQALATCPEVGAPEADIESRTDGEAAWARANGANLEVVRVRVCM